jgi:hypothetical protein
VGGLHERYGMGSGTRIDFVGLCRRFVNKGFWIFNSMFEDRTLLRIHPSYCTSMRIDQQECVTTYSFYIVSCVLQTNRRLMTAVADQKAGSFSLDMKYRDNIALSLFSVILVNRIDREVLILHISHRA